MKIVSISDEDTAIGLKLAGIGEAHVVRSQDEAEKLILQYYEEKDVGLIILSEKIGELIRPTIKKLSKLSKKAYPIVVEIPDKYGPIEREVDPLQEIIRRAVGIDIQI